MRRVLFALLLLLPVHAVRAEPLWQTLPATPAPVAGEHAGHAKVNGISLYYATIAMVRRSSFCMAASPTLTIGAIRSRLSLRTTRLSSWTAAATAAARATPGRTATTSWPMTFALLDTLHIAKADVVGWSDGAILGLDLAIRHPDRVGKVLAFAANTVTSGVQEGVEKNPTFAAFIERAGHEYAKLSATPKDNDAFVAQISKMWETEPNWTDAQLQSIRAPVLVADGDHDEAIKRAHTEYIAATIPGAGLLILPNTSHFAFLQDPTLFNAALLHFLGDR